MCKREIKVGDVVAYANVRTPNLSNFKVLAKEGTSLFVVEDPNTREWPAFSIQENHMKKVPSLNVVTLAVWKYPDLKNLAITCHLPDHVHPRKGDFGPNNSVCIDTIRKEYEF